jgi:hypothetical protein
MNLRPPALALLLISGTAVCGNLLACGDKFLVVGRGTRFQRASVPRPPAAILVYANPASNLPAALANVPVEATLSRAGYRPTTVSSAEEFDRAMRRGGWDLVLVDLAESRRLSDRVSGDNAPAVLPVVYNPTRTEWKEARRQYPSVLRSPTKTQLFLDTVDEALSLRRPKPKPGVKTSI